MFCWLAIDFGASFTIFGTCWNSPDLYVPPVLEIAWESRMADARHWWGRCVAGWQNLVTFTWWNGLPEEVWYQVELPFCKSWCKGFCNITNFSKIPYIVLFISSGLRAVFFVWHSSILLSSTRGCPIRMKKTFREAWEPNMNSNTSAFADRFVERIAFFFSSEKIVVPFFFNVFFCFSWVECWELTYPLLKTLWVDGFSLSPGEIS